MVLTAHAASGAACSTGDNAAQTAGWDDAAYEDARSEASALPTSAGDGRPLRLAVCLQATDGTAAPTMAAAKVTLDRLAEMLADWVPAEPTDETSRQGLELQVRSVVDYRTGSSFAQEPIVQAAVPPLPAAVQIEADGAEGGLSEESMKNADEAAAARADAIDASAGWQSQLRAIAESLVPTSTDATELDLVGCAFAARDWLLRGSPEWTGLVFVTSGEVGLQDVGGNPYATAGGLAGIDRTQMVSVCPSNDRCEYLSRSWDWFTGYFVGRDDPFIARDLQTGMDEIATSMENAGARGAPKEGEAR